MGSGSELEEDELVLVEVPGSENVSVPDDDVVVPLSEVLDEVDSEEVDDSLVLLDELWLVLFPLGPELLLVSLVPLPVDVWVSLSDGSSSPPPPPPPLLDVLGGEYAGGCELDDEVGAASPSSTTTLSFETKLVASLAPSTTLNVTM